MDILACISVHSIQFAMLHAVRLTAGLKKRRGWGLKTFSILVQLFEVNRSRDTKRHAFC